MELAEARQSLVRDFVLVANQSNVPPLSDYFAEYVKPGGEVAADDFRLVPLTPPCLRFLMTTSDCLTDCMFELQSRYQQFIPSDWGGHMEKGWRDLAVIGFNIEQGPVLEIEEIQPTTGYPEWAEPKWCALDWPQLLIRAVIEFGRACGAQEVRMIPASRYPLGRDQQDSEAMQAERKQRYDDSARALGFDYDPQGDQFTRMLNVH